MQSFMEHKGYQDSVQLNAQDQVLLGKVVFIPALISYEGTDVKSLHDSFHEAVDDYLHLYEAYGESLAKLPKGSFNARTHPGPHRQTEAYAQEHHKNLDTVITEALENYLETVAH